MKTYICPKCGAIAEKNAYYGRITCTSCDWEGYDENEYEPPKNKVEILMESSRRFDITTTAKTAKEFNSIIANIIDSGNPFMVIDDEYTINVLDICEIRFIEMSQISGSKPEYTKPKVSCIVGKDTKTEECEWCVHNSKCEIYKGNDEKL